QNTTGLAYIWAGTSYPIVFESGIYASAEDLSGFIQFIMKQNGHYLVDESDEEVYYLRLRTNSVFYTFGLQCDPVPAVLPEGWSNPAGVVLDGKCPQLVVASGSNIAKVIGFVPGTYPAVASSSPVSYNGTLVPQISEVSTIFILCS